MAMARAIEGDMRVVLRELKRADEVFHAVVTDAPYHLTSIVERWGRAKTPAQAGADGYFQRATRGFMGAEWDGGDIAFQAETWRLCWDLLPPGGHLVAFGGSRTFHRMAVAIEDAGFELRDTLLWLYGQGKPASHDASKLIDRALGAEREVLAEGKPVKRMIPGHDQNTTGSWIKDNGRTYTPTVSAAGSAEAAEWEGWGTALKPAFEPIILARKPIAGTIAANLLRYRTGAINIDGCRVPTGAGDDYAGNCSGDRGHAGTRDAGAIGATNFRSGGGEANALGRWPANILHDGSGMLLRAFAWFGENKGARAPVHQRNSDKRRGVYGTFRGNRDEAGSSFDGGPEGSAARFYYCAKATSADRVVQCTACGWRFMGEAACPCEVEPGRKAPVRSHPTVKPLELMRWLVRLVTPPRGRILDPFAGSGTTLQAATMEGFDAVGVEIDPVHVGDIRRRLDGTSATMLAEQMLRERPELRAAAKVAAKPPAPLPLFDTVPP